MLPAFPKAQKELDEEFNKQMFEWKNKTFPLHLHPPIHHIVEGKKSDFQREDRQIRPMNIEKHSVQATFSVESGKGMTLNIFKEKAKEVGEGVGKQLFQSVLGVVEEAAKETGNNVKIKKGELKQEDFLRMLEITQQNFDEFGNPTGQIVCGSEMADEFRRCAAEWKEDKEFLKKVEELKNRKRGEFNEREACRRLVE